MALAEIGKLNLVAMSYDKDAILNALQKTGATEVKLQTEAENTAPMTADCEELSLYLSGIETALAYISAETEAYNNAHKIKSDALADGFDVPFSEFASAKNLKPSADAAVSKINALWDEKKKLVAELSKLSRSMEAAAIYSAVKDPLCNFSNTRHAVVRLGTIPAAAQALNIEEELIHIEILNTDGDSALIAAAAHISAGAELEEILQNAGFTACPFAGDERSGEVIFNSLTARKAAAEERIKTNADELNALSENIKSLKIYCDYLNFELEKAQLAEKMRVTQTTFLLEAYVPKDEEERVKQALDGAAGAVYYEFSEPAEDEVPPTLYKNNKVVKNFETITNMYSPASSREFDPNTIMALFYSVFLGFIMGDVGYGLLMLFGGGFTYLKQKRDTGVKRLAGVFAVGGIFAIVWGLLFNSFFGITLSSMPTVMPNAKDDMWSFMGIKIPAVLIISLEIGVVQIFTGYVCCAVQRMRRGNFWDGVWDGLVWAVFSVGVGLAIAGLVDEANIKILAYIGGAMAGVALVIAMCTAGRREKAFGKFTKGFGAAYGVINYASDILSYARLYGLMLSGAVIAQIVSQYSVEFITGGNPAFAILGILLMVIGHAFNLAIGLLGAYIHDARLQYVEFYGRFYEGEGELFTPLGSQHKYIYING